MAEKRVQRRLAAILAADVVGYSRLMGEDEEGTFATLTAHLKESIEPCIAEQWRLGPAGIIDHVADRLEFGIDPEQKPRDRAEGDNLQEEQKSHLAIRQIACG